ncbi:MAG: hypothetical protein QXL86_03685 [Candidatus Aenigmatarchaeota archaeon]
MIFFFSFAKATIIEVEIPKSLEGNLSSFSYDSSKDIMKFQFEFYNTGSTAYKTRIRLDLINNSKIVFTGWSNEKILMPGDRKNFEVYLYSNLTGNLTLRSRMYFGSEIQENFFTIEKKNSLESEDVFEIKNFRTYDDFVVFDIKANKAAKDVVILPHNFPLGWIFEQKEIALLNENEEKTVAIKYFPTVWTEGKVNLIVASDGGKHKTERTFEMKKEIGILWLIYYLTDQFKLFLRAA